MKELATMTAAQAEQLLSALALASFASDLTPQINKTLDRAAEMLIQLFTEKEQIQTTKGPPP